MPRRELASTLVSRALIGIFALVAGCGSPAPIETPNIVLIISDDHGYPDHGFMGSARVQTPRLDRLAREGIVFTHGYSSASVCRPALATLLMGLEPVQLQFWEKDWDDARRKHPESEAGSFIESMATLPRLLGERGYTSFQAGKHWEGPFQESGFSDGMVDATFRDGGGEAWDTLVRRTIDPVSDFIAANREGPFFVWFAPLLPHLPHDAPRRYLEPYAGLPVHVARYYAAISWLDDGIGALLDQIHGQDLDRRTLIVYVADNGWDPGDAGWAGAPLGGPKGKMSLYELGFRTPVVLRWLDEIAPQPARSELVSFSDVFATLLDYAGATPPAHASGHSLRPLLEGREPWPRQELIGWVNRLRGEEAHGFKRGGSFWRDRRWHYLQPVVGPAALFDLDADPLETRDVAAAHSDVVTRAQKRVDAWTRSLRLKR